MKINEESKNIEGKATYQNKVNEKLQDISMNLKKIANIDFNYLEYISALIYIMYENKRELERWLEFENIKNIVQIFDEKIYEISSKEKSSKLFLNIKFNEIINKDNSIIFKKVIIQLAKLILEVDNLSEDGKHILAKAFEYIIMKEAQDGETSLRNGIYYTPKALIESMVILLDIKKNMGVYNPACGSGNFIIESARNADIIAFGDEINITNYNICNTNLWLHNIYNKRIKENNKEEFQLVDIAIGNPPFVSNNEDSVINEKTKDIYYKYGVLINASTYTKFLVKMLESVHEKRKSINSITTWLLIQKNKI